MGRKRRRLTKNRQTLVSRAGQGDDRAANKKARPEDQQHTEEAKRDTTPPRGLSGPVNNEGKDMPKRPQGEAKAYEQKQNVSPPSKIGCARKWKIVGGALMVMLTAVMAGANVVYAILGLSQLRIMSNQLRVMDEQLREMRASAQLEQRAWVGLSSASHTPIDQGKKVDITFKFSNTGKTPATIVTGGRTICTRPSDCDMEAFAATQEGNVWMRDTRSQGPLAPNATLTMNLSTDGLAVSDSSVADVKSGKTCIFMIGRIVYQDIFGKEHQTRFCYTANPSTDTMTIYHQYNYMD